ncbi:MAG TPA: hypothetical protein VL177_02715, partial [Terriglobales bacterium]|nr:hypothetical protein [Terriglobales bacterium]
MAFALMLIQIGKCRPATGIRLPGEYWIQYIRLRPARLPGLQCPVPACLTNGGTRREVNFMLTARFRLLLIVP